MEENELYKQISEEQADKARDIKRIADALEKINKEGIIIELKR